MTKQLEASLRARLRMDTHLAHERLDEEVSRFDLTTPYGFLCFLSMQSSAFQTLSALELSAQTSAMMRDLSERAARDLRHLGSLTQKPAATIEPVHPLAIDYAIAGSRLGSQLLKKRWQSATDPQVRRASAYFSAPSYIKMWTSFCETTAAMPAAGPFADQIVRDAGRIFHMYLECARAPLLKKGAIHA